MRKLHMALLSVFAAGVLLSGIGTGIAFGEYSSMKYEGTVVLGEEDMVTEELVHDFTPVDGEKIVLQPVYYGSHDSILEEDSAVPMGEIHYQITYNPNLSRPVLYFDEVQEEEAPEEPDMAVEEEPAETESRIVGYLDLGFHYIGDDFELLMENKDKILGDMKQGKFASYDVPRMKDVKIRVNPGMVEYIEDRTQG